MIVGISGPDGTGKSSTIEGLAHALGSSARFVSLYGCTLCRRLGSGSGGILGKPAHTGPGLAPAAHGLLDAIDLQYRLRKTRRTGLLITDRSPLDGLVRFNPRPGSLVHRLYIRATLHFDSILLLDAPAELLAARDGEHSVSQLQHQREGFARWSGSITRVTPLAVGDLSPAEVLAQVRNHLASL